jgi:hypothetical protein
MKIQEASKDITEGEIMFPCPKTSSMETKPKRTKKHAFTHHTALTCAREHGPCAPNMAMRLKHASGAPKVHFLHSHAPQGWPMLPEH